jgi:hypothetical protein
MVAPKTEPITLFSLQGVTNSPKTETIGLQLADMLASSCVSQDLRVKRKDKQNFVAHVWGDVPVCSVRIAKAA